MRLFEVRRQHEKVKLVGSFVCIQIRIFFATVPFDAFLHVFDCNKSSPVSCILSLPHENLFIEEIHEPEIQL